MDKETTLLLLSLILPAIVLVLWRVSLVARRIPGSRLAIWWHSYHWGFGSTERSISRIGYRMRILVPRVAVITAFCYWVLPMSWAGRHEMVILATMGWFAFDTFISLCVARLYVYRRAPETCTSNPFMSWDWIRVKLTGRTGLKNLMFSPYTFFLPQTIVFVLFFALGIVCEIPRAIHLRFYHYIYGRWVNPSLEHAARVTAVENEKVASEIVYALALLERVQKARIARGVLEAQLKALVPDDNRRKAMLWDAAERMRREQQAAASASSAGAA